MKLVHDNKTVFGLVADTVQVQTLKTVFTGTLDECKAEATRLNLEDPKKLLNPPPDKPSHP